MKIKNKLLIVFIVIMSIFTAGISIFTIEKLYYRNMESEVNEKVILTRDIARGVEKYISKSKPDVIDGIYEYIEDFNLSGKRILEIYLDDKMIFKNHDFLFEGLRKELYEAQNNYLFKNLDGKMKLIVTFNILNEGKNIKIVNFSDVSWIEKQRKDQYTYMLTVLFIAILLAGFSIKKILDLFFMDMEKLQFMSKEIGEGYYGYRINSYRKDEIGNLIESFNKMSSLIEKQVKTLEDDRDYKDRFLRNFNHEIKTPLTSIIGMSDMLYKGMVSNGYKEEMYGIINSEGKRILSLQKVVLKELEMKNLQLEVLDFRDLFIEIKGIFKYFTDKKNIEIVHIGEEIKISVNKRLFIQAIGNIVENAIRYSSNDSKIKFITASNYIEILDSGPGIPYDLADRVFELFEKGQESSGQGLGLFLTKKIVEKHGFEIFIIPRDVGTCFRITIL